MSRLKGQEQHEWQEDAEANLEIRSSDEREKGVGMKESEKERRGGGEKKR